MARCHLLPLTKSALIPKDRGTTRSNDSVRGNTEQGFGGKKQERTEKSEVARGSAATCQRLRSPRVPPAAAAAAASLGKAFILDHRLDPFVCLRESLHAGSTDSNSSWPGWIDALFRRNAAAMTLRLTAGSLPWIYISSH